MWKYIRKKCDWKQKNAEKLTKRNRKMHVNSFAGMHKIDRDRALQPVFTHRKILEDLKVMETKPSVPSTLCFVWIRFKCNSCDANYIGCTSHHLHVRFEEHRCSVNISRTHTVEDRTIFNYEQFAMLRKCRGKFECLIYEMLLIRKK